MTSALDVESATTIASLAIDPAFMVREIAATIQHQVGTVLQRRGAVVAMSGGVDSAVCAGLAVQALGANRVLGVFMPEHDSDPMSLALACQWAQQLGIPHVTEDISPLLEACVCYERRDAAVKRLVPEYGKGWRFKIVLPGDRLDNDRLSVFQLVVQTPTGETRTVRLPAAEYREIVAATNFKQRTRTMLEYYHADRLHYAVVGTPNRLEYDQGFFVKGGDGLADVKPIAHLYKTQVYHLAEYLGVPREITSRPPTTDTYPLSQSQEEFFFSLPMKTMDLVLHARNAGMNPDAAAQQLGLKPSLIARVYRDIERKRATTRYLHAPPLLAYSVEEIHALGGERQ